MCCYEVAPIFVGMLVCSFHPALVSGFCLIEELGSFPPLHFFWKSLRDCCQFFKHLLEFTSEAVRYRVCLFLGTSLFFNNFRFTVLCTSHPRRVVTVSSRGMWTTSLLAPPWAVTFPQVALVFDGVMFRCQDVRHWVCLMSFS